MIDRLTPDQIENLASSLFLTNFESLEDYDLALAIRVQDQIFAQLELAELGNPHILANPAGQVRRPSVVPNLNGEYGPEIYFDPQPSEDWPAGCWMCGIPEQDQYCGATPNDALAAWEKG